MNCTQCQTRLVDYLEGLLSEPQKQMVESHLQECPLCREELEELKELCCQLTESGGSHQQADIEEAVLLQIIREQHKQLKQVSRPNRLLEIGSKIMHSKATKYITATATAIAVIFMIAIYHNNIPAASANDILKDAINAVSDVKTVHMKADMRTSDSDNFGAIYKDHKFVPHEMWRKDLPDGGIQWRIEKPGRILVMDGKNRTLFYPLDKSGVRFKQSVSSSSFSFCIGRFLDVKNILENEIRNAEEKLNQKAYIQNKLINGKNTIILTVETAAMVPKDDYCFNGSIPNSNSKKIYHFDPNTKLLERIKVYIDNKGKEVLVFKTTDIEYNQPIPEKTFTLDLPEDTNWRKQDLRLPDNEKYAKMSPKEMATAFLKACSNENWDEVVKFDSSTRVSDSLKNYLGGLKIISIGKPFKSKGYFGWYVPYEIKLKNGFVKKHNLSVRNDNSAKRYIVDGGI
jgi:outer membrane lipoprotein-sorting protein